MVNTIKTISLVTIAIFISLLGVAAPNWSVNSANYGLDFSVIGKLNYYGSYSSSTNDMVAAFDSQGNIRGVSNITYNSASGSYEVNLTVLGNTPGDTITFKLYNAADDSIVNAINTPVIFQPNVLLGSPLDPYVITNANIPLAVLLDAPIFSDSVPVNTYVGKLTLSAFDSINANPTFAFTDSIGNEDSTFFQIRNDSLFTNGLFNYDMDSVFTLKISGQEQNMTVYNTFTVRVFKHVFTGNYGLYLNAPTFADSVSLHTYIGQISMDLYDSTLGAATFSFTDSIGNADSSLFYISNDSLFSSALFDYDSNYIFQLKINGKLRGQQEFNTFEVRIYKAMSGHALFLNAPHFPDTVSLHSFVGELSMTGYDTTLGSPNYVFTDSLGNADSTYFYIQNDSLFTNALFDYDSNYIFYLKINGSIDGFTTYNSFELRVFKPAPVVGFPMSLNAPHFPDSVSLNTFVGKINMTGYDTTLGTPSYAFTDTTGNADSTFFYIQNDSLFTNALFDYDSNYIFFVKIEGTVLGITTYESFELRVYKAGPVVGFPLSLNAPHFPDTVSLHTFVGKLNMTGYDTTLGSPTYAFTDTTGNADSTFFYIQNDSLFTNALFDYDSNYIFLVKIEGTVLGISTYETFELRVFKPTPTVGYAMSLNAPVFPDSVSVNTFVGTFSMLGYDTTLGSPSYAFTDTTGNADSTYFYIQNDSLFTNALFDYDSNYIFFIKVHGEVLGQTTYETFQVRIFKAGPPVAFDLLLDAPVFPDSVSLNTFVGTFSMLGYDTALGTPSYAFTDTTGNADSTYFYIQNDSLFTNALFNYDSNYIFFIKVHGEVLGQTTYETFQVRIFKAGPPVAFDLLLNAPVFADSVSINTFVGTFSMLGYDTALGTPTYAFTDTTGNADSTYFYIQNDSLFTNALFDYDSNYIFFLKVHGEVLGQTTFETFQVRIFKTNPPAGYALFLDAPIFSEAVPIDTYIGHLRMDGYDTAIGQPIYAFTDTIGNADSSFFYIRNDSVFTNSLFNYDSNYIFFLKVEGEVLGLTTYETFQVRISKYVPGPGFPMLLDAPTFADSVAIGTHVGTLTMSGFNTSLHTPIYSFTNDAGNNDSSYFYIQNDSLFTNRNFNYNSNYIFFVQIQGEVLGETTYETFEIRVFNSRPTAIDEQPKVQITMFPNPAKEWVQFQFKNETPEEANIFIYSATGQLVKQTKRSSSNQAPLNISDLKKGLYLVEISTPLNRSVKQLIITH